MTMSNATDEQSPAFHPPGDCILCGRCVVVCPLFAATGREELSPRAKFLLLGRLALDDPTLGRTAASELAGLCLSCGRCQAACPLGLCAPDAVGALRAAHPGWPEFLWGQWITRAGIMWPMAAALCRLAPRIGPMPRLAAALSGLDQTRAIPPWLAPARFDTALAGRRVAIFPGCVAAFARTDWTRAARRLLLGTGALLAKTPEFACCGAPLGHAGLPAAQDAARRTNIRIWREAGRPVLAVFCASCHHGLAAYPESLFLPGEADTWRQSVIPLSTLLGDTAFTVAAKAPQAIQYHQPCHAPPGDPDAALLSRAVGRPFPHGPTPCCGFGGLMQITAPDLSAATAAACWQAHDPPQKAHVLTSCAGCATQLAATAPPSVTVGHWLEAILPEETGHADTAGE
ncbi:(Fe-S)-binding protein [Desulfovibrio sulfodismutans]|uniref:(Fe-S)-binding protein n=2 Tax=Desulfolutivibrio sulfodismutans TaxID=63561 RepID=A0A7K3NLW9_9BACT|nr:(Fe-S)-binding protein [Desulfolutivibrio sulfodismutans]NDY56765.1 (Fe-S)-binding protein [Desulfolutivibrio sulfodismutans]QLA13309.1 4Fe-4S dicluster domain-containing protein [Desulfolutivibrio sulfodismutans DSM 3696]